ncbi:MAG: sigma 54-interacting transcriptional regulator [Deltaproteobacteria bacterium]
MADDLRVTRISTGLVSSNVGRAPKRAVCRVVGASQEVLIGARPVTVGADASCDLVLADGRVSRRHAELALTADGLQVRDLDSTNGTHYQGSRITEARVPLGASIVVGGTTLKVEDRPALSVTPSQRSRFGELVGTSATMREVFAILELAADSDATVLVEGETGTGKELVARALHDHSARASNELVVVDCSAIADSLVDSQLFGHRRGAFTGALDDRAGALVTATGGTLFLDELGELPLAQQAKLLRALEDQTVQPVGADHRTKVDTRIVAATHRDLSAMVDAETFRFDLFHRIAVVHVRLPPLRERLDDLPILVEHFYRGRGIDPGPIDGDNLTRLREHAWPGNVRELRNVLERAWVLTPPERRAFRTLDLWLGGAFEPNDEGASDLALSFKEAKERLVERFERRYLASVWAKCDYNVTRAAEHAGLNRKTFRELLQKHGIKRE